MGKIASRFFLALERQKASLDEGSQANITRDGIFFDRNTGSTISQTTLKQSSQAHHTLGVIKHYQPWFLKSVENK